MVGEPVGQGQIQMRHNVPVSLSEGTVLSFTATASALGQAGAQTSRSVAVR
jgi:hypothetical protein